MRTKKRLFDVLLLCFAILCICIMLLMPRRINLTLDGAEVIGDAAVIRKEESFFLPIRIVAEHAGYEIIRNTAGQEIVITDSQREIRVSTNLREYSINSEVFTLMTEPFVVENRTYMHSDDIASMLNLRLKWDEDSYTIILESGR